MYLWCNKGRLSLWILWCNLSTAFRSSPRLCQRLRPNGQLLFLSCWSYASLQSREMCLVYTLTTHTVHTLTHRVFLLQWGDTLSTHRLTNDSSVTTTWDVSLPHRFNTQHTLTHLTSNNPYPFIIWEQYSYGAIESSRMVLYSCGYSCMKNLAKYV